MTTLDHETRAIDIGESEGEGVGQKADSQDALSPNETQRLRKLLQSLEWSGSETHFVCPCCHRDRMHGHMWDCELQVFRLIV